MTTSRPVSPVAKGRPPLPEGPFLVVGLARSGQAAARMLAARRERVIGCDAGRPEGMEGLRALGVEVHPDTDGLDLLDSVKTVVKSPGVPAEAAVVAEARRRGIAVLGEMELAWRVIPDRFIAVTGTNGKTTTTAMIGHLFRQAGMRAAVAGNIGAPLCDLAANEPEPTDVVVCEASSFQLEDTVAFSPECAVFLNFGPDHLDRHGTLEAYRQAKLAIFANQDAADVAVLNGDDPAMPEETAARTVEFCLGGDPSACEVTLVGGTIFAGGEPLVDVTEMQVLGDHNVANAMAAAAAATSTGLSRDDVARGLASFTGVPHRLEPIGEQRGVLFVNDSKATNVTATATALRSFAGPVRAILGGRSKGEDFAALAPAVARHCAACYLIGEAAEEIARALIGAEADGVELVRCEGLDEAVSRAAAEARPGEVVLLSPGCASFDAFRDYEQRGERFRDLVEALR